MEGRNNQQKDGPTQYRFPSPVWELMKQISLHSFQNHNKIIFHFWNWNSRDWWFKVDSPHSVFFPFFICFLQRRLGFSSNHINSDCYCLKVGPKMKRTRKSVVICTRLLTGGRKSFKTATSTRLIISFLKMIFRCVGQSVGLLVGHANVWWSTRCNYGLLWSCIMIFVIFAYLSVFNQFVGRSQTFGSFVTLNVLLSLKIQ